MRFVILGARAQFSKNLRGTLLAICHFGSSVFQKLNGDTACDLSFGELSFPKPYGGHCLRFVILGAQFSKNLRGTLLAICHFGSSVFQGHCLRFVILGAQFSKNLRGTLLAICHFGSSVFQKLKGYTACDLSFWELSFQKT